MSLWILAACAVIWTARMVLNEWLAWLAARYRHMETPHWARLLGRAFNGGR